MHTLSRGFWIAVLVASSSAHVVAASAGGSEPLPPPTYTLTLAEARASALASSPELRREAAAVDELRGRLLGARTYPFNPFAELEGANRDGADGSSTDRALSLSQEVEIGGQRGKRAAAAEAALAAAESRYERRRREVLAAVERAFAETVRGRELLAVAAADVELTRGLLSYQERRLEAGAGTQINVNLARASTGRAVRRHLQAAAAWAEARARLAEAAGLDPAAPPGAAGGLPASPAPMPHLATLIEPALAARTDLTASRQERSRAERRVALERSLAVPNLNLGTYVAEEEGDEIAGLRIGIAIPLFQRNQGDIAEARAGLEGADAEVAAGELRVRRELVAAYSRYRAAGDALTALTGLVVENLEDSLELLRRAVDAGELSATDVLLLRRDLVEGRREHIEAAGELWLARTDLELAAGRDLAAAPREECTR